MRFLINLGLALVATGITFAVAYGFCYLVWSAMKEEREKAKIQSEHDERTMSAR